MDLKQAFMFPVPEYQLDWAHSVEKRVDARYNENPDFDYDAVINKIREEMVASLIAKYSLSNNIADEILRDAAHGALVLGSQSIPEIRIGEIASEVARVVDCVSAASGQPVSCNTSNAEIIMHYLFPDGSELWQFGNRIGKSLKEVYQA